MMGKYLTEMETSTEVKTTILNNGIMVLAKEIPEYGLSPVQYTNRTQASRKAFQLRAQGINSDVIHLGRPFYVKIGRKP